MRFKAKALSAWEAVWSSYWFLPMLMAVGAIVLSIVTIAIDHLGEKPFENIGWLAIQSPDGARSLLSTIAASMIGLAGVVFSITIVALTLASGQFGPRLLRNFMRDTGNQIVLGTFIAAFLYCLLVLRQVRGETGEEMEVFVPQLSMLVAVLLAMAGLGVLIYFIHHVAQSIQAPNVIAAVSRELHEAIDRMYPKRIGEPQEKHFESLDEVRRALPDDFEAESAEIPAASEGYIQRIDEIVNVAQAHDLIVRVERRPGTYVQPGTVVLRAWPRERVDDAMAARLGQTFTVNARRSLAQDAEFAAEQLVEIAVRALSTGVNDPFTAIQCVDRLGAAMSQLAERDLPSPHRTDPSGEIRVIAHSVTFAEMADTAFNQIRQNSTGSLAVLLRILEALSRIAEHTQDEQHRACLADHAAMVRERALKASAAERDRRAIEERWRAMQDAMIGRRRTRKSETQSTAEPQRAGGIDI